MGKTQRTPQKLNAVIYARYSSTNQNEQSIEGQLRECLAFAEREGYTVVGEYIDRALTGRTDERPQFQHMVSDSASGLFQVVIVWKLDRFSRNRYDSAFYKNILKKNGVRVISATERISNDPEGIILEGVIEAMSEYFSANLSQNVRRGQRENMANGRHVGGYAPYGYKLVDKKLIVIEEEAAVIRYAFEEYAKGTPVVELSRQLAAKGLTSRQGKPVSFSTLHNILTNKKYIGVYLFGDGEVVGGCDPIVDQELFERVQDMKAKKARGKDGSKAKDPYLLSGKLFCGLCGGKMLGNFNVNKKGIEYRYYQDYNRKFNKSCTKTSEKKEYIENYVVEQTVKYILQPGRMDYIASRVVARYEEEFNDSGIKEMEKQLAHIEREAAAAVDASIAAPPQSRKRFFDKLELLEAQKAEIEHELTIKRIAVRHSWTKEQMLLLLQDFIQGNQDDEHYKQRIIDTFINSVYVYDDKIVIYYNVKDGRELSYSEMINSLEETSEEADQFDEMPENKGFEGAVENMDGVQSPLEKWTLSKQPLYIFVDGLFGIVTYR